MADDENHYRALYRGMKPVPLGILEHTAQWTSERAAEIQQQFVRGDVNALSCSTTFELGTMLSEIDRRFFVEEAPGEFFERVPAGQLDLYEGRVVLARDGGQATIGRLWLSRDSDDFVNGAGVGTTATAGNTEGGLDLEVLAISV